MLQWKRNTSHAEQNELPTMCCNALDLLAAALCRSSIHMMLRSNNKPDGSTLLLVPGMNSLARFGVQLTCTWYDKSPKCQIRLLNPSSRCICSLRICTHDRASSVHNTFYLLIWPFVTWRCCVSTSCITTKPSAFNAGLLQFACTYAFMFACLSVCLLWSNQISARVCSWQLGGKREKQKVTTTT